MCMYPQELSYLTTKFDEALVFTWEQMRKQDLSLEHWWEVYEDQAKLVVSTTTFAKVLGCKGQWHEVAADLDILVANSLIGQRCFGHANTYVVGSQMHSLVTDALKDLSKKELITKADVASVQDAIMAQAANRSAASALASKRDISCQFRNITITFQVTNFQEEPRVN